MATKTKSATNTNPGSRTRKVAKSATPKAKRGGQRTPVELNDNLTAVYDRMVKLSKKAVAAKKAGDEARAAKEALSAAMGSSKLARLSDGRIIERNQQKRHWPPLPAKTITFWQFTVVESPS